MSEEEQEDGFLSGGYACIAHFKIQHYKGIAAYLKFQRTSVHLK
jgi:hypothetical protein